MKLQRKLTKKKWAKIVALGPGVHNYRGRKTLFYNGEKLVDDETFEPLVTYNWEERQTWKTIIVLPGVKVIPQYTFAACKNVKTVIMTDSVKRIKRNAFFNCYSLKFVKISRRLKFIGNEAFSYCEHLTSIFIPQPCRVIDDKAFYNCCKLSFLSISQTTELGDNVLNSFQLLPCVSSFLYVTHTRLMF